MLVARGFFGHLPNRGYPPEWQFGKVLEALVPFEGRTHVPKLNQYMTIKEAAEFLGVSENTLRNWGRDGKIRERRHPVNGYRLYSVTELDSLLKAADARPDATPKKPR